MGLFRRRALPSSYRSLLVHGERVLGWAACADGLVVATNLGLWVERERIGWHEISKAKWDNPDLVVTTTEVVSDAADPVVVRDRAPVKLTLIDPGHLPQVVYQRVTHSIVSSELQPDGSRLVGRRMPGVDGIAWTLHVS